MSSVTFPPAIGGDGSTVTDDNNPTTGLGANGHRLRFIPALAQLVAVSSWVVNYVTTKVAEAAAFASTAVNAPGTSATSTTSDTIATGVTNITLAQTGKLFGIGQWVIMANTAAPANFMVGQITAFTPGTGAMTISVPAGGAFGAGTFAAWTISLTSPLDSTLTGRVSALETEQTRLKARRRLLYKELN